MKNQKNKHGSGHSPFLVSRRQTLGKLIGLGTGMSIQKAPAFFQPEAHRPQALWGSSVGELSHQGAIVWSRCDQPALFRLEWALSPDFKVVHATPTVQALPEHDYTVRVPLTQLPLGRRIYYRGFFESLLYRGARSIPIYGEFTTPSEQGDQTFRFAWSGDSFGQGYGINPQFGGVKIYDSMRQSSPDLFIHCGDRIYADQPLKPIKGGGKGRRWVNLVTPSVMKVAETLDDFRGYYRYGLLDQPTRRFQQVTPHIYTWDDHEVKNDWWPGQKIRNRRYTQRSIDELAKASKKAFFEYTPLPSEWLRYQKIYRSLFINRLIEVFVLDSRSYRGPNTVEAHQSKEANSLSQYWGPEQLKWLKTALLRSKAIWKVIVCPQPLSLIISSGSERYDGFSSGSSRLSGREFEINDLLSFVHQHKIQNLTWLTADVHYAAAHHFHPDRATVGPFIPFWEFIAGPLNAATLRPRRMDPTFGGHVEFTSVPSSLRGGLSPLDGQQFYGLGEIHPHDHSLTISLHSLNGKQLFSKRLKAVL